MRPYEISKKAFDTPLPERALRSYQPFQAVSRANFMPFFIRSFMESRGSPLVHVSFVRLAEVHIRFDMRASLRNLLDWDSKNTWMKFNAFERNLFVTAYDHMVEKKVSGNPAAKHLIPRNKITIHREISPAAMVGKFNTWVEALEKDLGENNLAFPVSRAMHYEDFKKTRETWFATEYLESLHRNDDEKND